MAFMATFVTIIFLRHRAASPIVPWLVLFKHVFI